MKTYFPRIIDKFLEEWKNEYAGHYVLEIRGSRQVGKTTTLVHFGEKEYQNVLYLNLDAELGIKFFQHYRSLRNNKELHSFRDTFVRCCEELHIRYTDDEDTLLIIDEIQKDKEVYERIREMNRELHAHVIVTGSYMSRAFQYFQPAGDVIVKTMYPLSYREFIEIYNADTVYDRIKITDAMNIERKEWFDNAYSVFLVTGGYPAVISAYMETGRIERIDLVFRELLEIILEEAKGNTFQLRDRDVFSAIFSSIIEQLMANKKNSRNLHETLTKYINTKVTNKINKETCGNAIAWLHECNVITYCARYDLDTNREYSAERYYFSDVGLLHYLLRQYKYPSNNVAGILNENFVCSMLERMSDSMYGLCPHFALDGEYELDFVERSKQDDLLYGIEVKSGKSSGKSIQRALEKRKIDKALYLKGDTAGGMGENTITIPIWLLEHFQFNSGEPVERIRLEQLSELESDMDDRMS